MKFSGDKAVCGLVKNGASTYVCKTGEDQSNVTCKVGGCQLKINKL